MAINWNQNFETGISRIDLQHQRLVKMINDFGAAMEQGAAREVIAKTLDQMVAYAQEHFSTEEELFRRHGYGEAWAHTMQHQRFVKKVADLQQRYHKGEPVFSAEVLGFLSTWLREHILGSDKKYGPFLQSKGVV